MPRGVLDESFGSGDFSNAAGELGAGVKFVSGARACAARGSFGADSPAMDGWMGSISCGRRAGEAVGMAGASTREGKRKTVSIVDNRI